MSGAREITTKINSVKNTRKVTNALEMVSAAKIRKSQDLMQQSRPYARMIKQVIAHLSRAQPEYRHPFTVERKEIKRVGYIVVSSDRGLCGGLNNNLFRKLLKEMADLQAQDIEIDVVTFGKKATQFFKGLNVNLVASSVDNGESPQIADLIGSIKVLTDSYREAGSDRVVLAYNDFVNTMTQEPTLETILPLPKGDDDQITELWDYIYEPEARDLLDTVLSRYIESLIYQAVLENLASEHAARMVAMKAATDNAGDLIDELQLVYNKARQASITQELSEIVGGAAAIE